MRSKGITRKITAWLMAAALTAQPLTAHAIAEQTQEPFRNGKVVMRVAPTGLRPHTTGDMPKFANLQQLLGLDAKANAHQMSEAIARGTPEFIRTGRLPNGGSHAEMMRTPEGREALKKVYAQATNAITQVTGKDLLNGPDYNSKYEAAKAQAEKTVRAPLVPSHAQINAMKAQIDEHMAKNRDKIINFYEGLKKTGLSEREQRKYMVLNGQTPFVARNGIGPGVTRIFKKLTFQSQNYIDVQDRPTNGQKPMNLRIKLDPNPNENFAQTLQDLRAGRATQMSQSVIIMVGLFHLWSYVQLWDDYAANPKVVEDSWDRYFNPIFFTSIASFYLAGDSVAWATHRKNLMGIRQLGPVTADGRPLLYREASNRLLTSMGLTGLMGGLASQFAVQIGGTYLQHCTRLFNDRPLHERPMSAAKIQELENLCNAGFKKAIVAIAPEYGSIVFSLISVHGLFLLAEKIDDNFGVLKMAKRKLRLEPKTGELHSHAAPAKWHVRAWGPKLLRFGAVLGNMATFMYAFNLSKGFFDNTKDTVFTQRPVSNAEEEFAKGLKNWAAKDWNLSDSKDKFDNRGVDGLSHIYSEYKKGRDTWNDHIQSGMRSTLQSWSEYLGQAVNMYQAAKIFYGDMAEQFGVRQQPKYQPFQLVMPTGDQKYVAENFYLHNEELLPFFRSSPYYGMGKPSPNEWLIKKKLLEVETRGGQQLYKTKKGLVPVVPDIRPKYEGPLYENPVHFSGKNVDWAKVMAGEHNFATEQLQSEKNLFLYQQAVIENVVSFVRDNLMKRDFIDFGDDNYAKRMKSDAKLHSVLDRLASSDFPVRFDALIELQKLANAEREICADGIYFNCIYAYMYNKFSSARVVNNDISEYGIFDTSKRKLEEPFTGGYQKERGDLEDLYGGYSPLYPGYEYLANYHFKFASYGVDSGWYKSVFDRHNIFFGREMHSMSEYLLFSALCGVEPSRTLKRNKSTAWVLDAGSAHKFVPPRLPLKNPANFCSWLEAAGYKDQTLPFFKIQTGPDQPVYAGILDLLYRELSPEVVGRENFQSWWKTTQQPAFAKILDEGVKSFDEQVANRIIPSLVRNPKDSSDGFFRFSIGAPQPMGLMPSYAREINMYVDLILDPIYKSRGVVPLPAGVKRVEGFEYETLKRQLRDSMNILGNVEKVDMKVAYNAVSDLKEAIEKLTVVFQARTTLVFDREQLLKVAKEMTFSNKQSDALDAAAKERAAKAEAHDAIIQAASEPAPDRVDTKDEAANAAEIEKAQLIESVVGAESSSTAEATAEERRQSAAAGMIITATDIAHRTGALYKGIPLVKIDLYPIFETDGRPRIDSVTGWQETTSDQQVMLIAIFERLSQMSDQVFSLYSTLGTIQSLRKDIGFDESQRIKAPTRPASVTPMVVPVPMVMNGDRATMMGDSLSANQSMFSSFMPWGWSRSLRVSTRLLPPKNSGLADILKPLPEPFEMPAPRPRGTGERKPLPPASQIKPFDATLRKLPKGLIETKDK